MQLTCKHGGDADFRHNKLWDIVLESCHRAGISAKVEAGSGLRQDLRRTRPADILASNWLYGKPAAFDLNMTSPAKPFCYFGSRCHSRISSNSHRA